MDCTVRRTVTDEHVPKGLQTDRDLVSRWRNTMTRRSSLHWLLACSVATAGEAARAGPEECLTLPDNVAVAGCAHKYAPRASPMPAQSPALSARSIKVAEQSLLFPVPDGKARAAPSPNAPREVVAERDRTELIYRSEIGAVSLAAMGGVFVLWRWRASAVKKCSYCGTRTLPGATVCKRCFRSV